MSTRSHTTVDDAHRRRRPQHQNGTTCHNKNLAVRFFMTQYAIEKLCRNQTIPI